MFGVKFGDSMNKLDIIYNYSTKMVHYFIYIFEDAWPILICDFVDFLNKKKN